MRTLEEVHGEHNLNEEFVRNLYSVATMALKNCESMAHYLVEYEWNDNIKINNNVGDIRFWNEIQKMSKCWLQKRNLLNEEI